MLSSPNLINPNIAYLFLLNNLLIYDLPISKFKPTFSNADIIPLIVSEYDAIPGNKSNNSENNSSSDSKSSASY